MTHRWRCRDHLLAIGPRALVMGIVNVTPDSFSDGGRHSSTTQAVEHALKLVADGADILDIGGESSRPGALPVTLEEERRRVLPVVQELARQITVPLSIDTVKAPLARETLAAGASIINDITALQGDAEMAAVVRESSAGLVLMHMQGTPATMQAHPTYSDVAADIIAFFAERLQLTDRLGIDREAIALDPGFGFGKTHEHSREMLRNLSRFQQLGLPILLGVSRKGWIGEILNRPRHQRVIGSVTIACHAIIHGGAQIIRVHDVAEHVDAVRMLAALKES